MIDNNKYPEKDLEMEQRFEEFTNVLAKLSKKHGIVLRGDVNILWDKKNIKNISYDNDHTSGDLTPYVEYY